MWSRQQGWSVWRRVWSGRGLSRSRIRPRSVRVLIPERRPAAMRDEKGETGAQPAERPRSRRALLGASGAAVGAVAAGRLLGPDAADAADGGNLVLGQAN